MSLTGWLLEQPLVYRLWMAPFAEAKLAPLAAHNDLARVRRVLDVGCGPGTNAAHFRDADYLGVDINERYVADARRRHGRTFLAADITAYQVTGDPFDCILVNSFLHHVDLPSTHRILAHLATLLPEPGHVHIIELVLPPTTSPARMLAKLDRGDYPRPLDEWRAIFARHFEPEVFEPYGVGLLGVTLWQFVYFKGRARR
ncbi:MAG TPA: class I SAM-dependent methyltransferase [Gemmatimonadales bacterium]